MTFLMKILGNNQVSLSMLTLRTLSILQCVPDLWNFPQGIYNLV